MIKIYTSKLNNLGSCICEDSVSSNKDQFSSFPDIYFYSLIVIDKNYYHMLKVKKNYKIKPAYHV